MCKNTHTCIQKQTHTHKRMHSEGQAAAEAQSGQKCGLKRKKSREKANRSQEMSHFVEHGAVRACRRIWIVPLPGTAGSEYHFMHPPIHVLQHSEHQSLCGAGEQADRGRKYANALPCGPAQTSTHRHGWCSRTGAAIAWGERWWGRGWF